MTMRVLQQGMNGSDVKAWQLFLAQRVVALIQADGIFGPRTRRATIDFQVQQGLAVDGIVGANTRARARELGFDPRLPVLITAPASHTVVQISDAVELRGLVDSDVARIELVADDQFPLPTPTMAVGVWRIASRFQAAGTRRVVARAFNAAGDELGSDEIVLQVNEPHLGSLVPIPAGINEGLTMVSQRTMRELLGVPCALNSDCSPVTNAGLRRLIVTRDVGPFMVTGLLPAVEAMERIFAAVREEDPGLYERLGTAGMLCCRRVRPIPGQPPSQNFSNHSWGTAIDITINGALDPRGNGTTQLGLLRLHPYFKAEKFYWGAGFSGGFEDSMHFEASEELIREWQREGRLEA